MTAGRAGSGPSLPAAPDRAADAFLLALAAATLALHVLGSGALRGTLWGADAYAFLPAWALPAASLALVAALVLGWRAKGGSESPAAPWLPAAAAIAAFALFWLAREGHTFLGDGAPIVQQLARGVRFHVHEPLTVVIQHWIYTTAGPLFERDGRPAQDVARDAVALGSAVAGAAFVALAFPLGEALAKLADPARARAPRLAAGLATAVLCAQGFAQLFFGYVENYTWVSLAIGAYLLALLRAHERRGSLAPAGALLVLCVALHLAAATLALAWLVAAAFALREPTRRAAVARDAALVVLAALAMRWALARLGGGYDVGAALWDLLTRASQGHGEGGRLAYLFSVQHVLDLLNEHVLIGPAAALLALFGAARFALSPRARTGEAWLLLAAALPPLAAACATGDLNLGYPRDWDLFAPYAVVYTAAGIGLIAIVAADAHALVRPLALALALSLFHTVPWVAVNASFERSFERFKHLPLGGGRTESVVGQWYFDHGDMTQARVWLRRATDANPANTAAQWLLGLLAIDEGRLDESIARFEIAVEVRPDKANYRLSLVDVLALGGQPARALPHVRVLLEREPGRGELHACEAILLVGAGDRTSAIGEAVAAAAAAPADTARASLLAAIRAGADYGPLLRRWWDPLVLTSSSAGPPPPRAD
jgi:tetratricopeptide (TPR) repeat protein